MTMPWGKYRGLPLERIESSYLLWVIEKADLTDGELEYEIRRELGARFMTGIRHKSCPDTDLATQIVDAGLRALAKRHHPDVGGDTRTMQTLVSTADWLREVSNGKH